jgi:signal transduction histidine kinase
VESLTAIECSARSALGELDDRIAGIEQAEPTDPAVPTAEDLRRLGDNVRAAGTDVTLDVDDVDHLPPGVARAVFRIVQEALTNVMKHAAGGAATVHVEWVGRRVRVRVTDTGGTGNRKSLPSGSRGLAGMQERVALFGGQLSAGPDDGGGFVVDARIPVDAPLPLSVKQVVP